MTKEEVREVLLRGDCVHYGVWTWTQTYVVCSEGCCDCSFDDVDETLRNIAIHVGYDWEKVIT